MDAPFVKMQNKELQRLQVVVSFVFQYYSFISHLCSLFFQKSWIRLERDQFYCRSFKSLVNQSEIDWTTCYPFTKSLAFPVTSEIGRTLPGRSWFGTRRRKTNSIPSEIRLPVGNLIQLGKPNKIQMSIRYLNWFLPTFLQLMDVLQPRVAFSGHTHHSCVYSHGNHRLIEYSVPSFSWRYRNDPSYLLVCQLSLAIQSKRRIQLDFCWFLDRVFWRQSVNLQMPDAARDDRHPNLQHFVVFGHGDVFVSMLPTVHHRQTCQNALVFYLYISILQWWWISFALCRVQSLGQAAPYWRDQLFWSLFLYLLDNMDTIKQLKWRFIALQSKIESNKRRYCLPLTSFCYFLSIKR